MLLAIKDEARSHLGNEEIDFMLDNAYGEESLDELTASVMLMARLQQAAETTDTVPSYDDKAVSQVHDSSKAHEHVSYEKRKTIIQTTDNDQIDSSIIFDDPYVDNNGGTSKHDSISHEENHEIQMLAYIVQREAEKQKRLNHELKKQKYLLQQELETFKDRVKTFESQIVQCSKYKETCDDLKRELRNDKDIIERLLKEKDKVQSDYFKIENEKLIIQHETQLAKKAFKERENHYLEDIVDLEEKLSSHDRINPERLKKAIAAQPKMYNGDMLHSEKLIINSPNSEETLEDAEESRNKMIQVNYDKINALYETFVPQQEFSAEQTDFSKPSTSNQSSESKDVSSESPVLKMPNESRLLKMIDKLDIPEEDVKPKQIILDPDDQPMWESAKTLAPTPNSTIVQPNVDDNFVINSTHLNMIRENKFDGYLRADPHDHICRFLAICNMFKYGETQSEDVKLLIFPYSLSDKAKT
ncbi:hypothetical protein Tco_0839192 [Tanacetum coccineum]|uniref:Reverse transcriptase domain-containing protein n=1 Tax=Tanacetum coccineum TaxID=301880 RepID=A0ABQ5APY2_9ASTR